MTDQPVSAYVPFTVRPYCIRINDAWRLLLTLGKTGRSFTQISKFVSICFSSSLGNGFELIGRSICYSNAVSLSHRIGIELIQVRTGPSVGKPTYRGVMHAGGAREAVEEELRAVFTRMRNSGSRPSAIAITTPRNPITPTSTHTHTTLDGPSITSCDCGHDSPNERYAIEKQQQQNDDESGAAIRLRMEAMKKRFFDSWKSGEAREGMLAFAQWF